MVFSAVFENAQRASFTLLITSLLAILTGLLLANLIRGMEAECE